MIEKRADVSQAIKLSVDKGYDGADFVNELRALNVHTLRATRPGAAGTRPSMAASRATPATSKAH